MAKYLSYSGLQRIVNNIKTLLSGKVDVVDGKGLSTNDYTTTEKNKLSSIAEGAEVNVQSDWSVSDTTSGAYIQNKPTLGTLATQNEVSYIASTTFTDEPDDFSGKGLKYTTVSEVNSPYSSDGILLFIPYGGDNDRYGHQLYFDDESNVMYHRGMYYDSNSDEGDWNSWVRVYDDDYHPIALGDATGTLPINHGGTGATTAAGARTNLGIGTVGTLSYGSGTTTFLRNDGTWATPSHYTSYLYATNSATGTNNVNSVTNGNLRLNLVENGSVRSSRLIKGAGGATVTTDTSGNIVVTGAVGTTTDTTFVPLAT